MPAHFFDTPAKRPFSLAALADNAWNWVSEVALTAGWKPLTSLAETAVCGVMRRISVGQLKIVATNGNVYFFPSEVASSPCQGDVLKAELRVRNDVFWVRLCCMGDLGFSEAYMYGEVDCDDLVSLFQIFLKNKENVSNLDSKLSYLFSLPQKITLYRFVNTLSNSRSNISAHYDISNDMFAGFLSKDMTYSCAIFRDLDADLKGHHSDNRNDPNGSAKTIRRGYGNGNAINDVVKDNGTEDEDAEDELYVAQMRKLHHIIQKAQIRPSHRVLEIGSGWGSLSLLIARTIPGTTVDTLTLSVHQRAHVQRLITKHGLQARVHVHLMDYRAMPREWEGTFDRVVSVEMVESVGPQFLEQYWETIDWALKSTNGVAVIQGITIPEARYERYLKEIDFIRKWVLFPGGCLPTVSGLVQSLAKGAKNKLVVDSVSNIGPHYSRTLREWKQRFLERFEDVVEPALRKEYGMGEDGQRGKEEVEVFKRKWELRTVKWDLRRGYSAAFDVTLVLPFGDAIEDHIVTVSREGSEELVCDVYE